MSILLDGTNGIIVSGNTNSFSGVYVGEGNGALDTNTAVGRLVLSFNSTGGANSGFGQNALALNTTGSYNSGFGRNTLQASSTGSSNTAVGESALYSNSTASNNTAVGYQAGYNITTGAKNTILGAYNGNQDGLDIRTASNYAVISDGDGNRLLSTANGYSLALDGGAVPQTGTGITFPAAQSASSNANTLDDYEEGTWTPTDGSGAGLVLTVSAASYVKVGKLVFVNMYLIYPVTASTASALIAGLPFTSQGLGYSYLAGRVQNNIGNGAVWQIIQSDTVMASNPATNSGFAYTNADYSGSFILFSGCYVSAN